jgi:hypothetical protein
MSAPLQETMHGKSPYIKTDKPDVIKTLEFYPFAPAKCSCCAFLAPQVQKDRQVINLYDNRISGNIPIAPFACLTCDEKCIIDRPYFAYHDRPPSRVGMCCFVIPATCCGPPVIFVKKPICCCVIDCTDNFGELIMAAPCNCFGLKQYLCCGGPCYLSCAVPVFGGVRNGASFLNAYSKTLDEYFTRTSLDASEKAIFEIVKDSEFDIHSAEKIPKE